MNIFYLNHDPKICAQMHNDSHCSKMIIEYAQLMSTAHRYLDGEQYYGKTANGRKIARWKLNSDLEHVLYKASHIKHPSGIWVRKSISNYKWLYEMWTELNNEFMYRYNHDKPHESYRKLHEALERPPTNMYEVGFCEPYQAMFDDVKNPNSSIRAYHDYYIKYKQHLAKWTKRGIPYWYQMEDAA